MTWSADLAAFATDVVDPDGAFGEPVTLPGEVAVTGVFSVYPEVDASRGDRSRGLMGSEVGRPLRLSQQSGPRLWLTAADAAALAEQDTVTVRGTDYFVTRIDPDGDGLVSLSLMPTAGAEPANPWRWQ